MMPFRHVFVVSLSFLVAFAQAQVLDLRLICELPNKVKETSGIYVSSADSIWTHNDSGGDPIIYVCDTFGNTPREIILSGSSNTDWEDVVSGNDGYLYMGDFGNNFENRTNLKLFRFLDPATVYTETVFAEPINFSYEDQTAFPPPFSNWYFDCEASIIWGDSILLFTKDWSIPFIGHTRLYYVPKELGTHVATFLGSFYTDNTTYNKGGVTGASLSPDKSKLVLVSNRKLWLFYDFVGKDFFNGTVKELDFPGNTQMEAVNFLSDNCTVYLTDEQNGNGGGNLYTVNLCDVLSGTDGAYAPANVRAWATYDAQGSAVLHWDQFEPTKVVFFQSDGVLLGQQAIVKGSNSLKIDATSSNRGILYCRLEDFQGRTTTLSIFIR